MPAKHLAVPRDFSIGEVPGKHKTLKIITSVESRAMSASMSTYPAGEQMHDREGPFAQATKGARACALGGRLVLRYIYIYIKICIPSYPHHIPVFPPSFGRSPELPPGFEDHLLSLVFPGTCLGREPTGENDGKMGWKSRCFWEMLGVLGEGVRKMLEVNGTLCLFCHGRCHPAPLIQSN